MSVSRTLICNLTLLSLTCISHFGVRDDDDDDDDVYDRNNDDDDDDHHHYVRKLIIEAFPANRSFEYLSVIG